VREIEETIKRNVQHLMRSCVCIALKFRGNAVPRCNYRYSQVQTIWQINIA